MYGKNSSLYVAFIHSFIRSSVHSHIHSYIISFSWTYCWINQLHNLSHPWCPFQLAQHPLFCHLCFTPKPSTVIDGFTHKSISTPLPVRSLPRPLRNCLLPMSPQLIHFLVLWEVPDDLWPSYNILRPPAAPSLWLAITWWWQGQLGVDPPLWPAPQCPHRLIPSLWHPRIDPQTPPSGVAPISISGMMGENQACNCPIRAGEER